MCGMLFDWQNASMGMLNKKKKVTGYMCPAKFINLKNYLYLIMNYKEVRIKQNLQ